LIAWNKLIALTALAVAAEAVVAAARDGGDDLAAEAEAEAAEVAGDGGDDLAAAVVAAARSEKKVERPVPRSRYSATKLRRREISFSYPLGCH
jgi:hypothetical protein